MNPGLSQSTVNHLAALGIYSFVRHLHVLEIVYTRAKVYHSDSATRMNLIQESLRQENPAIYIEVPKI